jgi:hypothetical protein
MDATGAAARRAGLWYFVFMIVAIFGEFVLPAFRVPGDAAATARNITAAELTYRVESLTGLVTHVIFLFLVVSLYQLFRDVDRGHALRMVLFVAVGVAVALGNMLHKFEPLELLSGADAWSGFTQPQLDALALGTLGTHRAGGAVPMTFWGLWLFPFGILVVRSGFLPRVLGVLLLVAGGAYVVTGVTAIVLPDQREAVARWMMPLYFGEVPIIFWLLIKGARRVPQ